MLLYLVGALSSSDFILCAYSCRLLHCWIIIHCIDWAAVPLDDADLFGTLAAQAADNAFTSIGLSDMDNSAFHSNQPTEDADNSVTFAGAAMDMDQLFATAADPDDISSQGTPAQLVDPALLDMMLKDKAKWRLILDAYLEEHRHDAGGLSEMIDGCQRLYVEKARIQQHLERINQNQDDVQESDKSKPGVGCLKELLLAQRLRVHPRGMFFTLNS